MDIFAPLFAVEYAAAEKTEPTEASLTMNWLLGMKGWDGNGFTRIVEIPSLVASAFHSFYGAVAIFEKRPEAAFRLATFRPSTKYKREPLPPIFRNHSLTGWPEALDTTCTTAWTFLRLLADHWTWMTEIFGGTEAANASLSAYYLFLNAIDFAYASKGGKMPEGQYMQLEAPVFYVRSESDVRHRIETLVRSTAPFLELVFKRNGISKSQLPELWEKWIALCRRWEASVYRDPFHRFHDDLPHQHLPDYCFRAPDDWLAL